MTQIRVSPSSVSGAVTVPASKSHTLRAILFASMADGDSLIRNFLQSPDAMAMIQACRQLGATIHIEQDQLRLKGCAGRLQAPNDTIDAGNSGQVLRFIAAIAALSEHEVIITGDTSIRTNRPVGPLLEGLMQLGATAESVDQTGFAPIRIQGPAVAGTAYIDGADSQPVSGLLMLMAFLPGASTLQVSNPGEKPWVDLTLDWFDRLGIAYQREGYDQYRVAGSAALKAFEYTVPSDFSSMAYPIVAALITHQPITLHHVDMQDCQGDKQLIAALQQMGAQIETDDAAMTLTVKSDGPLVGQTLDINNFIDAITILAVVACFAQGETRIVGAAIARAKECDRINAMATELKKMGADIQEMPDGLIVKQSALSGADLETYHDHRLVMSLTVAALGATGDSTIKGIECVDKSYPGFVVQFQSLGAAIEIQ